MDPSPCPVYPVFVLGAGSLVAACFSGAFVAVHATAAINEVQRQSIHTGAFC